MTRAALLLLAAALGCNPSIYQNSYVRPATLQFYDQPVAITAPDTVDRNATFTVEFTTYGGGCIERARNEVAAVGLDVRIWSRQRVNVPGPDGACTDDLRYERNVMPLTIRQPGTARIRVFGQREPGAEPLVVERQVVIR